MRNRRQQNLDSQIPNSISNQNQRMNEIEIMHYNKIIYTPRTGHAVIEHRGIFYLFAGADSDSRTNDMYQFNPNTK